MKIYANKMKTFLLTTTLILFGFLLGACGSNVMAEQNYPLKIWKHNENGAYETLCVEDEKTGVNYVVVATEVGNGNRSIAITPRLNADGSLYIK